MSEKSSYIVSGATRGLGLAFCEHITAHGYRVYTLSRSATDAANAVADRIDFSVDLSDPDARSTGISRLCSAIRDRGDTDRLYLINNAARLDPMGRLSEASAEDVHKSIELNLAAVIDLSMQAVELAGELGCSLDILNVTSGAAGRPISGLAIYCSTKAAVDMFTRVLASEHQASLTRACG